MRTIVVLLLAAGTLGAGEGAGPAAAPARATGALPLSAEAYERESPWRPGATIAPTRATVDLRPFLPPVADQGRQPSCTGFAVAYVLASYHEAVRRGRPPADPGRIFSPAHVYNATKVEGGGAYLVESLRFYVRPGILPLEDFPYDDRTDARIVRPGDPGWDEDAVRARGFGRVGNGEEMRHALASLQPVVIAMATTEAFLRGDFEVYRLADHEAGVARPGSMHGMHALVAVGYDDDREAFLVQNSWGPGWGKGGFGWLHYDLFAEIRPGEKRCVREAWVADTGRALAQAAWDRLSDPRHRVEGIMFHSGASRLSTGEYSFLVAIPPWCARSGEIRRVEWTWTADGRRRTRTVERAPGDEEATFEVHGESARPGRIEFVARIRFDDGSVAEGRHHLFIHESPEREE